MANLEYIVCSRYSLGWEEVYTATTKEEGQRVLKEYRINEPEYDHKLKIKKEKTK